MEAGQNENRTAKKPKDKLTFFQKVVWSIGAIPNNILANSLGALAMPIYNTGIGLSFGLVSLALGIPRFWDAITDPVMGNISDNTTSRWGRRRPYIAVGIVLSGIFFALLWTVPSGLSDYGIFAYLLVVSILYYTAYTIFAVPWNAMGLALTPDYNERTRVMAYRAFFGGVCAALFLPWLYKLCLIFHENEVIGARYVGVTVGIVIIVTGLVPAIWGRERIESKKHTKISFLKAFVYTFKNGPFIILAMIVFMVLVGVFMIRPFGYAINAYYVAQGDKSLTATLIGVGGTVLGIMGIISAPIISFAGTRIGKKTTMLIGQGMVIISSIATWFLYTPKYPYLQVVYFVIAFPGMSCIWILGSSMTADICDIDELKTGMRREGMYGAVFAWIFKLGVSTVVVLGGFMAEWAGIDPKLEQQTDKTIFMTRFLFAAVPTFCLTVSFILTLCYPITEKRMKEVRAILDARNETDPETQGQTTDNS